MSSILNSYPLFANNQVLTSAQLNELVAYLDEQNRLTRAKLIGTGVACGFELKPDASVNATEIAIFKGIGVTSQGYLMTDGDCVVRRYRPYNLPAGVRYEPFEDPSTTVQDVILYELLTDDAPTLPTDLINPLNSSPGFANNKVVLLFLECVPVNMKSCLGKSCDDTGSEMVMNLRKLLISKTDMDKVLARTCAQTALFQEKYNLPEIFMKRALFNPNSPSTNASNYFAFSETYVNALKADAQPATGVSIYDQLFIALKQTYTDFAPLLSEQYNSVNPFTNYPDANWTNFINGTSTGPRYLGMQYFYDFLKDLILAYNEFRDVAFDIMSECCSDMDCYPKHLMLGEVSGAPVGKPSGYRHYFVLSPIFDSQKEKVAHAVSLFQRMVLMVKKFDLPTINNPSTTIISPNTLAVPIFITPSNEKRDPLSKRSMPYYYRVHEAQDGLGTLEQSWNYTYTQKNLFSKGLAPLGYGNQDAVQTNDQGPVKTPLYYDTDPYNFYRVEGQIRSHYLAAKNQIEKIKNDFDLPFNVIALRLTGDPFDDITERCNFDDLRTEYGSIRTELLSLFKNLTDRYGVKEGTTIHPKAFPAFLSELLSDATTDTRNGSYTPIQTGVTSLVASSVFTPGTATDTGTTVGTATPSTAVNNAGDNSVFRSAVGTGNLTAAAVSQASFPVFAPRRSMAEAKNKLNADLQEMLNALNTLNNNMLPFNVTQFKFGYTGTTQDTTLGFIQYYLIALQAAINVKVDLIQILDLVLRSTRVRNTPELYMDLSVYLNETLGLLEKFITDSRYKSLTLLNYTLQYRIGQLKSNDMTLFSNFIKKHPGLEHAAGVKKGGTLILVYNGNAIAVDPIRRSEVISQIRDVQVMEVTRARLMQKPVLSQEDVFTLNTITSSLVDIGQVSLELSSAVPVQRIAIEADQVIADFSLPYLCCCDCECDDIDHPTTVTQLNMPALAVPFYVEYNLGDYAFGKDADQWVIGCSNPPVQHPIDIVPLLQFENIYRATDVRLYLVDRNGNKLTPDTIAISEQQQQQKSVASSVIEVTPMSTGNYPNDPTNVAVTGIAKVLYDRTFATRQQLAYSVNPATPGFVGVDSFYYMFEIVGENGEVVRRSTIGKITINVVKNCATGTTTTGTTTTTTTGTTVANTATPANSAL
ncbi:MAG: hypothetical protein JWO09_2784 [Bacteroidetes bacterium]|nr:hypothetical protein [Bacteroidota bacterium]